MNTKLYKVTCDPLCGFEVQSHNRNEVAKHAKAHVDEMHADMKMTMTQVDAQVKEL